MTKNHDSPSQCDAAHDSSNEPLAVSRSAASGLQIDVYGIKVPLATRSAGIADPESWRDVAREINRQLMAVATNAVSLAADVLKAARSLVRGIGDLPVAVATRVQSVHARVDHSTSVDVSAASQPGIDAIQAKLGTVTALLQEFRNNGINVEIYGDKESGDVVFLLTSPGSGPPAMHLAAEALLRARAVAPQLHQGDRKDVDPNIASEVRRLLSTSAERDEAILRAILVEKCGHDEIAARFGVEREYLRVLLHRTKAKSKTVFGDKPGQ